MTSHDADDPLLQTLGELSTLTPDPARAERVRARCRTSLARTRRRVDRAEPRQLSPAGVVARTLVGSLCLLYVAALFGNALRLHGLF